MSNPPFHTWGHLEVHTHAVALTLKETNELAEKSGLILIWYVNFLEDKVDLSELFEGNL